MGTRAHWFSHRWRYREPGALGWTYAETLRDIKDDVADGTHVEVQRRTGTKRAGYEYEHHSHLNTPHPDEGDLVTYVIRCMGLAGFSMTNSGAPVGAYLKSYDPEAYDGRGWADWTNDLDEAQTFPESIAAFRHWQSVPASRPTRPDGHPNKPLTAFTVEILSVDDARAESEDRT